MAYTNMSTGHVKSCFLLQRKRKDTNKKLGKAPSNGWIYCVTELQSQLLIQTASDFIILDIYTVAAGWQQKQ